MALLVNRSGGATPYVMPDLIGRPAAETLDRLRMYVSDYKISGLKLYTFDATPKKGWWFDDEQLAYPIWEECRKLGVKNRTQAAMVAESRYSIFLQASAATFATASAYWVMLMFLRC